MAACCSGSCKGTDQFFSRHSQRYIKAFRKKGLDKIQRFLLDGVRRVRNGSSSILDIGCGVGALHLTLLREGATRATGVDISEKMIESARTLSEEFGLSDKTTYIHGDFVAQANEIGKSDVTMLDKVVCCYEDLDSLLRLSLGKTRRVYALTHPRDTLFIKTGYWIQIGIAKLFRMSFHPFWHDWNAMHRQIEDQGFEAVSHNSTIFWQAVVFRRTADAANQGAAE